MPRRHGAILFERNPRQPAPPRLARECEDAIRGLPVAEPVRADI